MFTTHNPAILRRALAGILSVATIAIAGCGSLQPPVEDRARAEFPAQESSAPAEQDEPAEPETTEQKSGQATRAETTATGTRLKAGQRAVIPYRKGTIGVTVTDVEKGDPADLLRQYGQRAKGITPYYIRFTIENVDGTDHSYSSGPILSLVTADGGGTGAVLTGTMPDCDRESAPQGFSEVGASFESCRLAGARTGVAIVGAKFADADYREEPVVWRR
ncbi:hypothetical protein ABGB18_43920 [Nonomuraea sp. B12E4]|uniref:hypothetical protein n=1 Tax=Nonomuraea sp. B12E4 TaxID=3153564 RepID=UPI00325D1862